MKGRIAIELRSPLVGYHLVLDRKVTVLRGDSGTGKSVFRDLVFTYLKEKQSRIEISLEVNGCDGLEVVSYDDNENWKEYLSGKENKVIVLDEDNTNVLNDNQFPGFVKSSNNYFIIISRNSALGRTPNVGVYEFKEWRAESGILNILSPLTN